MRLDLALVQRRLCESRTEAQECIKKGDVIVNGGVTTKQSKEVSDIDSIDVMSRRLFVSRGGEKLDGALHDVYGDSIKEHIKGRMALDIGSSTGGFTDCLLSYGVSHVDCVDVGTNQLHERLRKDSRVSLFEQTDIRDFITISHYDIVVADLSFISLEKVFGDILQHIHKGTELFLLIKPQFEVGKGNTDKGIVKDVLSVEQILEKYRLYATGKGLTQVRSMPSHLQGGDGNQEYFLYGRISKSVYK